MSRLYLSPPHVGPEEREALLRAFDSNWIAPVGPEVDAFEQAVATATGTGHAAALSSGTAALHLALLLLGVGAGDDVFVPTLTFAATANVVRYVNARPVFLDVHPATWTLDPAVLADALETQSRRGKLPKALITVDLYGQCCDYDPILELCNQYGVIVVQDAAEALGASYRGQAAGAQGTVAAVSFNGNKIVTTSGGGALVSNHATLIAQARKLATQAREPAPHYEHTTIGYNYRLSNLLAAVGRAQLARLPDRVEARRGNYAHYVELLGTLPGWTFMGSASYGYCTHWLTVATTDPALLGMRRDDVISALAREDIESRPVWKPMHLQPVFKDCPSFGGEVATRLFESGICLPSGSALTERERSRVARVVRASAERTQP